MGLNPELPISFAASALKNLLIADINGQEISVEDFTVSNDHPNNISDHGPPSLNLYPFLINETAHFKNVTRPKKQDSMQGSGLKIHFLLSAAGDHTKLFPYILLDSAIKTIKANPVLVLEECNYTLKITSQPLDIEESTMIWTALKCSHRINIVLLAETVDKSSKDSSLKYSK